MTKLPLVPVPIESRNSSGAAAPFHGIVMKIDSNRGKDGESDDVLVRTGGLQGDRYLIISNDEFRSSECGCDPGIIDSPFTKNVGNGNGFCIEDRIVLEATNTETVCKNTGGGGGGVSNKPVDPWASSVASEIVENLSSSNNGVREPRRTFSTSIVEVNEEMKMNKQMFPLDIGPLWGSMSICGRRREMEDAVVSKPHFLKIPRHMLSDGSCPVLGVKSLHHHHQDLTGHVIGVYDGHGGRQVAEYCRERLHLALAEEIGICKESLCGGDETELEERWLEVFMKCFHRLDDEVGGFPRGGVDVAAANPPVAPESVGSTAVVAVVCSSHIIVANCGDSRAVLCRGKAPMPLSDDHKPNREDECERIEAAGGKVINWDGYRVSGVLAVSRSIGDRYLRPYVVADPEITFISRAKEDECLILASDGLWDVMTNDEACDLARRRILLWHKKNYTAGVALSKDRGDNIDPAAQDAADYLSKLAFRRGSRDNISVIVVDLKAQRKLKKKS